METSPQPRRRGVGTLWPIGVVVLLILVMAMGGALLYNPSLLTGGFYEFTVTDVIHEPSGVVYVLFKDRIAYGTQMVWERAPLISVGDGLYFSDGTSWSTRPGGNLRWPKEEIRRQDAYWLSTSEEREAGFKDMNALRSRLLLKPGTYRLRIGEKLVYYRRPLEGGRFAEGRISVIEDKGGTD